MEPGPEAGRGSPSAEEQFQLRHSLQPRGRRAFHSRRNETETAGGGSKDTSGRRKGMF